MGPTKYILRSPPIQTHIPHGCWTHNLTFIPLLKEEEVPFELELIGKYILSLYVMLSVSVYQLPKKMSVPLKPEIQWISKLYPVLWEKKKKKIQKQKSSISSSF